MMTFAVTNFKLSYNGDFAKTLITLHELLYGKWQILTLSEGLNLFYNCGLKLTILFSKNKLYILWMRDFDLFAATRE